MARLAIELRATLELMIDLRIQNRLPMANGLLENTDRFDDLPPRNWRQWWGELPGWFRIGFWAGVGLVVVHLLLGVRIAVGLIEPREIALLRRPGVDISVRSDFVAGPLPGFFRVLDGLKGRSCTDVVSIRLDEQATDADLEHIGRHFPNVTDLYLPGSQVTSEGLSFLKTCRQLRALDLSMTDLNDSAAQTLSEFTSLVSVQLDGTPLTDAAIPALKRLSKLNWIGLSMTDVTLPAIREWRSAAAVSGLRIGTDRDHYPDAIRGVIRWADGTQSGRFSRNYETRLAGPIVSGVSQRGSSMMSSNLTRQNLWWDSMQFMGEGDREYELSLKLEEHISAPVRVKITDGRPSTTRVEFLMPVAQERSPQ